MIQNSHLVPWFWLMPFRSYAHPSLQMNFYWKLKMDYFASMQGFHPKEGLSWKILNLLMIRTQNCSSGPQNYTSSFIMGYEHSWVALFGDQAPHSMSMKFHSDSSQKPCSSLISLRSSVVPSHYESYNHLRVSHHRFPLGWLCLVMLILTSLQGS